MTEEGLTLIRGWRRKGLTQEDIAKTVGVTLSTLSDWKSKFSGINEALKTTPDLAINETENALYKAARGYFVTETTKDVWKDENGKEKAHITERTRWVQPSVGAQCFILKNRDGAHWSDKPTDGIDTEDADAFFEAAGLKT